MKNRKFLLQKVFDELFCCCVCVFTCTKIFDLAFVGLMSN